MGRRVIRPFATLLLGAALAAAAPTLAADGVIWVRATDGSGENDMAHAVAVSDNAVVAAGYFGSPAGYDDAPALAFSPAGTPLWRIVESGAFGEDDIFFDAGFDAAGGNFYLLGYTTYDANGNTEILLVKVAGDGTVLWRRAFLPPGYKRVEWNPGMAVHDGKAFVAATVTRDLPAGGEGQDIALASFGPDNTMNWSDTVDAWGGPDGYAAVSAAADGLVVLGTVSNGTDNSAMSVRQVAYDTGTERWSAFLYEPDSALPCGSQNIGIGMAVSGEEVIVTGAFNDPGTDNVTAALAVLDAGTGAERWRLPLGPSLAGGTSAAGTLAAAGGGTVFIAGSRSADPDMDIFVAAVRDDNTAGTFLWERTVRGPNSSGFTPGFLGYDNASSRVLLGAALPPAGGGVPLMTLRAFRADTGADAGTVVVPGGGGPHGDRVDAGAPDGAGGFYLAGFLGSSANGDDLAVARIGPVAPPPPSGDGGGGGLCMAIPINKDSCMDSAGLWGLLFVPAALLLARRVSRRRGREKGCNN